MVICDTCKTGRIKILKSINENGKPNYYYRGKIIYSGKLIEKVVAYCPACNSYKIIMDRHVDNHIAKHRIVRIKGYGNYIYSSK